MWQAIQNETDIQTLMKNYYGFHDTCIVAAKYTSGAMVDGNGSMELLAEANNLTLYLESQVAHSYDASKKRIALRFSGLQRMNLIGIQNHYFCDLFSCYLHFYKGHIVWASDGGFNPEADYSGGLLNAPKDTFVAADQLEWRFEAGSEDA